MNLDYRSWLIIVWINENLNPIHVFWSRLKNNSIYEYLQAFPKQKKQVQDAFQEFRKHAISTHANRSMAPNPIITPPLSLIEEKNFRIFHLNWNCFWSKWKPFKWIIWRAAKLLKMNLNKKFVNCWIESNWFAKWQRHSKLKG